MGRDVMRTAVRDKLLLLAACVNARVGDQPAPQHNVRSPLKMKDAAPATMVPHPLVPLVPRCARECTQADRKHPLMRARSVWSAVRGVADAWPSDALVMECLCLVFDGLLASAGSQCAPWAEGIINLVKDGFTAVSPPQADCLLVLGRVVEVFSSLPQAHAPIAAVLKSTFGVIVHRAQLQQRGMRAVRAISDVLAAFFIFLGRCIDNAPQALTLAGV
jgi:hypothetical protein